MRTRAIPERLRGAFTTRRYTNPRLPLPLHVESYIPLLMSMLLLVTSADEVMFSSVFYFFLCLLANSSIFAKVLPDATLNKEELFEYWKSFVHRSGPRNFLTVLHHGSIGHFCTIWLTSLENRSNLHENFVIDVSFGHGSPTKFQWRFWGLHLGEALGWP